jgi:hypothetical protein
MSHPVGDIALNAAFVKALQAFFAHAGACTKGCELEPPKYCNKGFKLRTAHGDAWRAFEKTLERGPISERPRPADVPPFGFSTEASA